MIRQAAAAARRHPKLRTRKIRRDTNHDHRIAGTWVQDRRHIAGPLVSNRVMIPPFLRHLDAHGGLVATTREDTCMRPPRGSPGERIRDLRDGRARVRVRCDRVGRRTRCIEDSGEGCSHSRSPCCVRRADGGCSASSRFTSASVSKRPAEPVNSWLPISMMFGWMGG